MVRLELSSFLPLSNSAGTTADVVKIVALSIMPDPPKKGSGEKVTISGNITTCECILKLPSLASDLKGCMLFAGDAYIW